MKGPLAGYRVADISRAIAGAYGSMILADLGAEVIKIEPPFEGATRDLAGPRYKGESFYFLAFNRNKKGITLDLGTKIGKEAFYDLVKVSDVVWDNFRPDVMKHLGADYETLKKINPRIISASVTGYGQTGPYSRRASYDIIALALSGIISITGEPGGKPVRPGVAISDLATGMFGAMGVASALAYRERTGEGQKVDVNLLNTCIALLAYELSYYFVSGIVPGPSGSGHLSLLPYGVYKCKEGYIALGPAWPRLAHVIGADWMIDDPKFRDRESRLAHRDEFQQTLEKYLAAAPAEDWVQLLSAEDIPVAPINNVAQGLEDPQIAQLNMILNLPHALGGNVRVTGNPIKMPTIDEGEYFAPPTLGQYNQEIFEGLLGYSPEKVKKMHEEEVVHKDKLMDRLHKTSDDPAARLLGAQEKSTAN